MVITMAVDPRLNQFYDLKDSSIHWTPQDLDFWCNFAGLGKGIPILAYMLLNLDISPSVAGAMEKQSRKHLRAVFAAATAILVVFCKSFSALDVGRLHVPEFSY